MSHLARGATSSAATPLLAIWTTDGTLLVDPDAGTLTFTVVDISTEEKEAVPVEVIAETTVNLVTARIGTGEGHFAAAFTVPADEAIGAHEIRWAWEVTQTVDGEEVTTRYSHVERFDVLVGVPRGLGGGYALVSDFRSEGIDASSVSDVRLLKLLREQQAFVDRITKRWFEPRFVQVALDGIGKRKLLIGQPIIALDGVSILDEPVGLDPASRELVIYNRHLKGCTDPDDRQAPRLEIPEVLSLFDNGSAEFSFVSSFPKNAQNVQIHGLFGYTDPVVDPTGAVSPLGETPLGIKKATLLLVKRNLPALACDQEGFDAKMGHRIREMRTRDQTIIFADKGLGEGAYTTDLEIDNLLQPFVKPFGAGGLAAT